MRGRLLALVAAVAMVVVAVQVRARLDDRASEGRPRIVCVPELAEACAALGDDAEVVVEAAGATAVRLTAAGDALAIDAWATLGPWPAVVRSTRMRAAKAAGMEAPARPLARSRLVLAHWESSEPVRKACGAQVGWGCLVKAAASPAFKLGFPDARRDSLGLVALGSAAQSLAPDGALDDDSFRGQLDALARAVPNPLPPYRTVLAGGPSLADAYATVEAYGGSHRMKPAYPAPVVAVDVLVGRRPGGRGERAEALLRDGRVRGALVDAGWKADVTGDAGLPSADVLEALRALWEEVAP